MTNRITEFRTSQGWSQAQLAELLSISRQTVIAIEQSKTDPSLSTAMRVAWLFRKPIESIFLADIDEQMVALNETWEYKKKTATAFTRNRCAGTDGRRRLGDDRLRSGRASLPPSRELQLASQVGVQAREWPADQCQPC